MKSRFILAIVLQIRDTTDNINTDVFYFMYIKISAFVDLKLNTSDQRRWQLTTYKYRFACAPLAAIYARILLAFPDPALEFLRRQISAGPKPAMGIMAYDGAFTNPYF